MNCSRSLALAFCKAILDPLKDFNLGIILHMGHHKWDPIFFKIIKCSQPMRVVEECKRKNGTRTLIFGIGYWKKYRDAERFMG